MKSLLMSLAYAGGDWVIWALVAASVAAVAAIIDRFILLKAETAALDGLRAPLLERLKPMFRPRLRSGRGWYASTVPFMDADTKPSWTVPVSRSEIRVAM